MAKYIIELEQDTNGDFVSKDKTRHGFLHIHKDLVEDVMTPYEEPSREFEVGEEIEISNNTREWQKGIYRGTMDGQYIVSIEGYIRLHCYLYARKIEEQSVDWNSVAVDTPILVKWSEDHEWSRRYFAQFETGRVFAWDDGKTSWTSDGSKSTWRFAKLAKEER